MQTGLELIRDEVAGYAEILSKLLKVDIEIMDTGFTRIAGTGKLRTKVGANMAGEGHVYKATMQTRQTQVIEQPGLHPLCQSCAKKGKCKELFEMSVPIVSGEQVLGVIGFVCYTSTQKRHIQKNLEVFSLFLTFVSNSIALRVEERRESGEKQSLVDLMESIFSRIDTGVLVLDPDQNIVRLNQTGAKLLNLPLRSKFQRKAVVTDTGLQVRGQREYTVEVEGTRFGLTGTLYQVGADHYDRVLLFSRAKTPLAEISPDSDRGDYGVKRIVGKSGPMVALKREVQALHGSTSNVLLTGPRGTEKATVARAIHEESDLARGPFLEFHCASVAPEQLEAELFGTRTGQEARTGKLEQANRGTLFLNEVDALPLPVQLGLAQALELQQVLPAGTNKPIRLNLRVIAATSQDLEARMAEGAFREELYYRLGVIPLSLPALSQRPADIKLLARSALRRLEKQLGKKTKAVEEDYWQCLLAYNWPGNLWELSGAVEYSLSRLPDSGILSAAHLPAKIARPAAPDVDLSLNLSALEKETIQRALALYGNDLAAKQKIAENLGISVATLYRKMKLHDL